MSGHRTPVELPLLSMPAWGKTIGSPILWLGLSLIAGIALGRCVPVIEIWLCGAAASVGMMLFMWWLPRRRGVLTWACVSVALLGGAWLIVNRDYVNRLDIARYLQGNRQLVRVQGVIEGPVRASPKARGPFARFSYRSSGTICELAVAAVKSNNRWREATGRLLVKLRHPDDALRPGDHVRMWGWLAPIHGPSNAGEFDYRKYLWQTQHIAARLTLDNRSQVQVLNRSHTALVNWRRFRSRMQQRARRALDAGMATDSPVTAMLHALLLGDRGGPAATVRQAFVQVGLAHLMAMR